MKTLYKKEVNYYLNNPVGYIVIILFSVFLNFWTVKDSFISSVAAVKPFFNSLPWFLLIFIPALAMRIFAEEKRINTLEVLLTLPLKESEIVFAKFLALLSLVAISLLLTIGWFIFLASFARLYFPEIFVGYLGVIFLSSALISLSIFFSNKTKNQIVAFLLSLITIFLLFVLGSDFFASVLPKFIIDLLVYFSPLYHYESFTKGIIDLRAIFYFSSFIILFLFLTTVDLERKK